MVEEHVRFIKFILVGLVNTLVGYLIFFGLISVGLHYAIASLLGTILGVLFNFYSISKVVYNSFNYLYIFRFLLVYIFVYLLNISLIYLLMSKNLDVMISGFISIVVVSILTYFLLNKFVYS
jgi:putative flippase GtrA